VYFEYICIAYIESKKIKKQSNNGRDESLRPKNNIYRRELKKEKQLRPISICVRKSYKQFDNP